ncbi:MAG TPA: hypothetical protein VJ992_02635, partial [Gemmatimonadales bacterium]|nr:hypothetical protein [Gemmatimonadales bacterium]
MDYESVRRSVADSVRSHGSYWLVGAIVGTAALGILGASAAPYFSGDKTNAAFGDVARGFAMGAALGFPLGALIGGQFAKH